MSGLESSLITLNQTLNTLQRLHGTNQSTLFNDTLISAQKLLKKMEQTIRNIYVLPCSSLILIFSFSLLSGSSLKLVCKNWHNVYSSSMGTKTFPKSRTTKKRELALTSSPSPSPPLLSYKLRYNPVSTPHTWHRDMECIMQAGMKWRKGDIVVSVPAKSGTTWTMNIVHQLRSGGDPEVRDIYEQVHWLEFWEHPTQSPQELWHRWDAQPTWYPRAFKSHTPPPLLPYQSEVKYVVVVRDPRDAMTSALPFFRSHREEWKEAFGIKYPPLNSVADIYNGIYKKGLPFLTFVKNWWPYRNNPNVLMLHYNNMIQDHKNTIKTIQNFLQIELSPEKFEKVCEYTSFPWMKKHSEKFSIQHLLPIPMMEPEAMIRKGEKGEGIHAFTKEMLEEFDQACNQHLSLEQKNWMLYGGVLP
jgi:hypothetical protein